MVNPRAPLKRPTAFVAVTILVLSLVLTGSGAVAAQGPAPKQYGPATAEEQEALQKAAENTGAPDNPVFPGGYPAMLPEAPEVSAAGAIDAWSANWAVGRLCGGSDKCLVGDFDGDRKDDVAVAYGDPGAGAFMVALSKGNGLRAATKWADSVCIGSQVCKIGDVNADGKDDLVIFNHGPESQAAYGAGNVLVLISQGNTFKPPAIWHNLFCVGAQICEVGNFDGYAGDDIALFRRSSEPEPATGDVNVALSNGFNGFGPATKWHEKFCLGDEECRVADMNGDSRDDIVAFVKSGDGRGRVAVALSGINPLRFLDASDWARISDPFCSGDEQCTLGDFDGNGADDALKFVRNAAGGAAANDVIVRLSNGAGLMDPQRWHDSFCFVNDDCAVGDFNGDGRADAIRFVKQSPYEPSLVGAAYVALAGGSAYGFIPTPPPGGKWLEGFCKGNETCTTGDFNGDGLTDIVSFVRDTQAGTGRGDVFVSLNINGTQFGAPTRWQDFACVGQDICKVGDVDKDGDDDLIIFSRVQIGPVYVSKSTGSSFEAGQVWNPYFCIGGELCDVGDFNGDGYTDIALFTRSTYGVNARAGDVEVALNTGSQFVNTGVWHNFFCIGSENCQVADVNGDGKDDIVAFAKGGDPKVYVELSSGTRFGDREAPAEQWEDYFCPGNETCDTGDMNGDGKDDILAFTQGNYPNTLSYGDVWVGISKGSQAAGGFEPQKWQDYFCIINELCDTGYFNRDSRKDIITFKRSDGVVFVALASPGTGYYFWDSIPVPDGARRTFLPMVLR